jgi:hypothetical protein
MNANPDIPNSNFSIVSRSQDFGVVPVPLHLSCSRCMNSSSSAMVNKEKKKNADGEKKDKESKREKEGASSANGIKWNNVTHQSSHKKNSI